MTLSVGSVINNRYRIAKLVGQGGFGAVYRAWDMNVSQPVALKVNLGADREAQRQFEREATLLAGLRHPSLPRVTDHFVLPGEGQFLVMDFIEGKSLADLLHEGGRPLAEAEVLPWMRQVCDALTYLHGRTPPIIHRDIKPDNVIITPEGHAVGGRAIDGRAILVDFGISKVFDADHRTTLGAQAVTPGYSPPEQYGMLSTDARSDVYALAATLYRVLTAKTPPESVAIMAAGVRLDMAHEVNPAVSLTVSDAIAHGMAPLMSQRTASAAEFAESLSAAPPAVASATPAGRSLAAPLSSAPPAEANQPFAPVAPSGRRRVLSSLLWAVFGAALSVGLFWLASRAESAGIDWRLLAFVYGLAYFGILVAGGWGGTLAGLVAGAAVAAGMYTQGWLWPFLIAPVAVGLVAGLLGRREMGSFLAIGIVSGVVIAGCSAFGRWFISQSSTPIELPWDLSLLAGVVVAALMARLLGRLVSAQGPAAGKGS